MTVFWLLCVVLALAAVSFIVWPLFFGRIQDEAVVKEGQSLREQTVLDLFNEHLKALEAQYETGELDEAQFTQMREELELSLLDDLPEAANQGSRGDRWGLYVAALLLPVLALSLYVYRGAIADVGIAELRDQYFATPASKGGNDQEQDVLEELVVALTDRLAFKPDNQANRYLLARSLMQQGRYGKAIVEYTHLAQSDAASAMILGELAQAVFLAAGNRITPEVDMLVERALQMDGTEATSLGLAGISAFEKAEYQQALDYWGRAVQQLGPFTAAGQSLQQGMARAKALMSKADEGVSQAGKKAPQSTQDSAVTQSSVQVQVSLAEAVAADPSTTVFVYARAWQGAKMPLAIQRLTVADFPRVVTLDQSMAMAPGVDITSVPELEILARVSFSGQPVPQTGDWQGSVGPVELSELDVPLPLVVDQVIP